MTQAQNLSEVTSPRPDTTSPQNGFGVKVSNSMEKTPADSESLESSNPISKQQGDGEPTQDRGPKEHRGISAKPESGDHRLAGAKTGHPPSSSQVSTGQASRHRRASSASKFDYDVPDSYANIAEASAFAPIENRDDAEIYKHRSSLERTRSLDQQYSRDQQRRRRDSESQAGKQPPGKEPHRETYDVSRLATQLYTISYLILFSIFGTLARLGLQALTYYPGAPLATSVVWPNFAGCIVMGFLSEDRKLFLNEWGTPKYHQQIQQAKKACEDEGSGDSSPGRAADIDLAAAKKAHMATKKTIPLYIGLATGFCGSFTSFSSFIRDVFLALSNDLTTPDGGSTTTPRNGGFSFMALLAVVLTTVSLSISGLFVGAHLAICLEPVTPSLPFFATRKVVDRVCVLLAWGCWLGAVLLSIFAPDRSSHRGASETWRGGATFALVFAPLGCLGRFYASMYLNGRIASFPLGTFAVNIFGTAILGMAWDLAHVPSGGVIGCQVLQGIEDGFCGCLTTVSTWVSELTGLRRRHAYIYGFTSVVIGLAFMVAIMGGLRWSHGFASLKCLH
ncbi:hypothetical protein PG997_002255 [Apiospora hydei]|uniref:Chromosome condensation protein n=1 Tax=Apiospora hydei TaxID=1337664 RepID=A0ABR1X8Z3_9PEZI